MEHFPLEIIEKILGFSNISIKDVINYSSTCKYAQNVIHSQLLWKQKYHQRWPYWSKLVTNQTDFYQEIKSIYKLQYRTRQILETMPEKFHKKYLLSDEDLEEWLILLDGKSAAHYHYLICDLCTIINSNQEIKSIEPVPLNTPGNKTTQYYAKMASQHIRQAFITRRWKSYLTSPPNHQILETGASMVAQWCQTSIDISDEDVHAKFNEYAALVEAEMAELYPAHPLLRVAPETKAKWRRQLLDRSQWRVAECRQVIHAMRIVLYDKLDFAGSDDYYAIQNSLMNCVLRTKRGLPITLAIVHEAVGRRLGLLFEPINFPAHFLLRFTEEETGLWYYIDVFNKGNIVKPNACPHSRRVPQRLPVANAAQVIERVVNNLDVAMQQQREFNGRVRRLKSILELMKLVSPQNLTALVSLAKFYMVHNMNTRSLQEHITTQTFEAPEQAGHILQMLLNYSDHREQNDGFKDNLWGANRELSERTDNLKYAIGMVMEHKIVHYKCVIYDWHPYCIAPANWQNEIGLGRPRPNEPCYNVLCEDGSYKYVEEELLEPSSDLRVLSTVEDLGRYFSHSFVNHFVPNYLKEREYPDDAKIRHKYYQEMNLVNYRP